MNDEITESNLIIKPEKPPHDGVKVYCLNALKQEGVQFIVSS